MGNFCCETPLQKESTINSHSNFYQMTQQQPHITNPLITQVIQKLKPNQHQYIFHNKAQQTSNNYIKTKLKNHKNGSIYKGGCFNNRPQGYGQLFLANGQYFQGQFNQGIIQGHGIIIKSNGEYYVGQIKNNKANGSGKFNSVDYQFQGIWVSSEPISGRYKYKNGIQINVINAQQCQIIWPNGDNYKGQVKGTNPHGFGKMIFSDLKSYEGYWNYGQMHGQGKYKWPDGTKYEGEYRNSKKQGTGRFYYKTGKIYDGEWYNGKPHGKGRIIYDNMVIDEREWYEGEPLNKTKSEILYTE